MRNCPQLSASGRATHGFTRFRGFSWITVAGVAAIVLGVRTGATLPPGYPLR